MPEQREQGRTVSCTDVSELLPVFLNGSLDDVAARRVESHLATCAACRREERDNRTAMALFEGHLPVELLLDFALSQPMTARRRAVVESHLAVCERCSEEVATVRQDRAATEPASRHPQPTVQHRDRTRVLAWAAGLAAAAAAAGWIWTWQQLVAERTAAPEPAARTNLPVVELLPAIQTPLRHGGSDSAADVNRVQLSGATEEIVLVLLSGGRSCEAGCTLEIYHGGEAEPKWQVEGLAPTPDGHLTLALPGDWLAPDRSSFAVRDSASGEEVARYSIVIRQPAATETPRSSQP